VFSPNAGIVPYAGFCDPKLGFLPTETEDEENVLLPNMSNKEKNKEPTGVLLEEVP
jgi:hypothetical protein